MKHSVLSVRPSGRPILARRRTSAALAATAALAGLASLGSRFAGASTWVGGTSQDWNDTTNWDSNPSGQADVVNKSTGNYPIVSATPGFNPMDIVIGDGSGNAGRLDQTGGALQTGDTSANGNWFFTGRNNGTGTYNLTGAGSLTVGKLFAGGGYFNAGGTGTITINTTGTVNANSTQVMNDEFGGSSFASIDLGVGNFGTTNVGNGTLNLQSGTLNAAGEIWVGSFGGGNTGAASSTGLLNQTGGAITAGGLVLGKWGGTGTVSITNGTLSAGFVRNGGAGAGGDFAKGTINVNGGGTLSSENDFVMAFAGNASGTLNVATNGTVNVATTTKRWFIVNQYDTTQGTLSVNGGTLNLNANTDLRFSTGGGTGTSVVNLNGGAINSWNGNGSSSGVSTSAVVDLNQGGATTVNNTFNLNGGTLTISQIMSANPSGTRVFNFNGGTLRPTVDNAAYFASGAASTANVRNVGAVIDTNGNNVTIGQALVHSTVGGDNAIDGGLSKLGTGTLTLTGSNTYTGGTMVSGGTLAAGADFALGTGNVTVTSGGLAQSGGTANDYIADTATLSLAGGTTDFLNYTGTDTIRSLVLNGFVEPAGIYGAGTNPTFFTGAGTLTVTTPEPASLGLLALGAAGLLIRRPRRRRGA